MDNSNHNGNTMLPFSNLKDGQWHSQASDDGVTYKAKWTQVKAAR